MVFNCTLDPSLAARMSGSSSSSFFKVLIDDFKTQLRLPTAFTMNFDGGLPEKCTLRIPTKSSWIVSIKNVDEGWIFCDGWQLFVNDNALEFGEFMVFRYRGNSEFTVRIFGRNACSRELDLGDKKDASSEKIVNKEVVSTEKMDVAPNTKCRMADRGEDAEVVTPNTKCRMADRREDAEVSNSFSVTLAAYKKFILVVPRRFAKKMGLPEKESIVLLDPQGRSWRVKISRQKNGRTLLSTGWVNFCRSNNVDTNDTCRFEFVEGIGDVIRVEIDHRHNQVETRPNVSDGSVDVSS